MNLIILTKVARNMLIGSLSAYLSFASKHNPSVRLLFIYLLGGTTVAFVVSALWEARDYLTTSEPTEGQISTLLDGLSGHKPGRKYYLSTQARLEIVIAFVVLLVGALIGGI